jgi:uncharacterized protein
VTRSCFLFCLVLGASSGGIGCQARPVSSPPKSTLRIGTSVPGGGFIALAGALLPRLRTELPGVEIEIVETRGALANLRGVEAGSFELAFVFADMAYEAFNGGLGESPGLHRNISGVAVLQIAPVHLVAGAGTGIQAIDDLRGRRIAIGGSGTAILSLSTLLLRTANVDPTSIKIVTSPLERVAEMVTRGEADGFFEMAAYSEAVDRALAGGATLVPLQEELVNRVRLDRPFLHPVVISRRNYRHLQQGVLTLGVDGMLICGAELSEQLVHDFTNALVVATSALLDSNRWNLVPLDQFAATSIPLHPGARRYYREQELLK